MSEIMNFIRQAYGTRGTFTAKDLLREMPDDLIPAEVTYASRSSQGRSASMSAWLQREGEFERAGRAPGGKILWRVRA